MATGRKSDGNLNVHLPAFRLAYVQPPSQSSPSYTVPANSSLVLEVLVDTRRLLHPTGVVGLRHLHSHRVKLHSITVLIASCEEWEEKYVSMCFQSDEDFSPRWGLQFYSVGKRLMADDNRLHDFRREGYGSVIEQERFHAAVSEEMFSLRSGSAN